MKKHERNTRANVTCIVLFVRIAEERNTSVCWGGGYPRGTTVMAVLCVAIFVPGMFYNSDVMGFPLSLARVAAQR